MNSEKKTTNNILVLGRVFSLMAMFWEPQRGYKSANKQRMPQARRMPGFLKTRKGQLCNIGESKTDTHEEGKAESSLRACSPISRGATTHTRLPP